MDYNIVVIIEGKAVQTIPLPKKISRIGSDPGCDIVIAHSEVAPRAASIDFSGKSVLFQNGNSFPVYVGMNQLEPSQWIEWTLNSQIHFTYSIVLELQAHHAIKNNISDPSGTSLKPDSNVSSKSSSPSNKKNFQIITISICILLGLVMLFQGESNPQQPETKSSKELIDALKSEEAKEKNRDRKDDYTKVIARLQFALKESAHLERHSDRVKAKEAFSKVFQYQRVFKANDSDTLFNDVRKYVISRMEDIDSKDK